MEGKDTPESDATASDTLAPDADIIYLPSDGNEDIDLIAFIPETDGPREQHRITCCLPGEGKTCCAEDDRWCFPYGDGDGTDGLDRCREVGEEVGGKAICRANCCEGLTAVNVGLGPRGCDYEYHGMGIAICLRCGDGICGDFEDYCSCPEDCHK